MHVCFYVCVYMYMPNLMNMRNANWPVDSSERIKIVVKEDVKAKQTNLFN